LHFAGGEFSKLGQKYDLTGISLLYSLLGFQKGKVLVKAEGFI
jgi:hypothetical protein